MASLLLTGDGWSQRWWALQFLIKRSLRDWDEVLGESARPMRKVECEGLSSGGGCVSYHFLLKTRCFIGGLVREDEDAI
jgi:hypothetical protein